MTTQNLGGGAIVLPAPTSSHNTSDYKHRSINVVCHRVYDGDVKFVFMSNI